jgi:hypothetical protein
MILLLLTRLSKQKSSANATENEVVTKTTSEKPPVSEQKQGNVVTDPKIIEEIRALQNRKK